jgi:putative endopeptidase
MLGKAGYGSRRAAQAVYDFEHKVAELEWARQALRNRDITYNKLTSAELWRWRRIPAASGCSVRRSSPARTLPRAPVAADGRGDRAARARRRVRLAASAAAAGDDELLTETPLDTLKAYMAAHFLATTRAVLPHEIDDANFAFYGTVLSARRSSGRAGSGRSRDRGPARRAARRALRRALLPRGEQDRDGGAGRQPAQRSRRASSRARG